MSSSTFSSRLRFVIRGGVSCRNISVCNDTGQQQGGKWRLFGRLQDDSVTAGQRRGKFESCHDKWKVPRHDLCADSNGFTNSEGMKAGVCSPRDGNWDCSALEFSRPPCIVEEDFGGPHHVNRPGDGD